MSCDHLLCKLVLCMLMGYWHVRVFVVFNRAARVVAVLIRWNLGLLCVFAPDLSVRREKSLWGSTPWRLCLEGTKRDMFARGHPSEDSCSVKAPQRLWQDDWEGITWSYGPTLCPFRGQPIASGSHPPNVQGGWSNVRPWDAAHLPLLTWVEGWRAHQEGVGRLPLSKI